MDMAIAFVMGGAFTKLVTAFIDGLVMPLVGSLTAGVNFQSLKYVLNEATFDSHALLSHTYTRFYGKLSAGSASSMLDGMYLNYFGLRAGVSFRF